MDRLRVVLEQVQNPDLTIRTQAETNFYQLFSENCIDASFSLLSFSACEAAFHLRQVCSLYILLSVAPLSHCHVTSRSAFVDFGSAADPTVLVTVLSRSSTEDTPCHVFAHSRGTLGANAYESSGTLASQYLYEPITNTKLRLGYFNKQYLSLCG